MIFIHNCLSNDSSHTYYFLLSQTLPFHYRFLFEKFHLWLHFYPNHFLYTVNIKMSQLVWIILVVVVIVLIYIIYLYITKNNVVLASTVYLNDKTAKTIENDKITSPKSANFALGFWLYVNSWNTNGIKKVFSYSYGTTGEFPLSVSFDTTKPILYAEFMTGCSNAKRTEKIVITNNFPLQKWVYVIISANGNYIDCYLDGKIITSYQIKNQSLYVTCIPDPKLLSITMGTGFDAYIYNFQRYTQEMTPTNAMSTYYSTAPAQKDSGFLAGYGMNIQITKDGAVDKSLPVF